MRKLQKLIDDYNQIETATDLKRRRLSLCDYRMISDYIKEINEMAWIDVLSESIKNYFERFGFTTSKCEHSVGYIVMSESR